MMNKKMILAALLPGVMLCSFYPQRVRAGNPEVPPVERVSVTVTDHREGQALWDQTKFFPETGRYVTPVQVQMQDENKSYSLYKYLVSDADKAERITEAQFLYLVVNNEATDPRLLKQLPMELPAGFYTGKESLPGLTGAVLRYSQKYEWLSGLYFEKGEEQKGGGKLAVKVKEEYVALEDPLFTEKAAEKCTSYYLMVTDENGQIINVTYLFSHCEDQEPGGGGGGFTPASENCNDQLTQFKAFIDATHGVTDAQPQSWTQLMQQERMRKRSYQWVALINYAGFGLLATAIGTQEYVPTKSKDVPDWEWVSLVHHSLDKYGTTIGGTVDYSATAISTIGRYWAGIELSITLKWHLICSWMPVLNNILPDTHHISTFKIHVDAEPTNEY